MHLLIDIRFYRPEPYGLAVYIRDLFVELVPLLAKTSKYDKVILVMDKAISEENLSEFLPWWQEVQNNSKFQVYFSASRYYSVKEQTWFLFELLRLKPDLTFFFNFNFPIFFPLPFVYQVLDLTIPKTKSKSLKLLLAKMIIQIGLRRATKTLFLGGQTMSDAEAFSGLNFSNTKDDKYRPNTVVYCGISEKYLSQTSASPYKSKLIGFTSSPKETSKLDLLKKKLNIKKEYFLFVSVWRKYKNVERLVEAFEKFNIKQDQKYQFIIGGKVDEKYPEVLDRVVSSPEYKKGNIIAPGTLTDEELILLQDGALAYVFPSLSEGFGLTLIEASSRGTPVICSDIEVFKEILPPQAALFFNPIDPQDIAFCLEKFVTTPPDKISQMIRAGYKNSQKYTWTKTARQIGEVLKLN